MQAPIRITIQTKSNQIAQLSNQSSSKNLSQGYKRNPQIRFDAYRSQGRPQSAPRHNAMTPVLNQRIHGITRKNNIRINTKISAKQNNTNLSIVAQSITPNAKYRLKQLKPKRCIILNLPKNSISTCTNSDWQELHTAKSQGSLQSVNQPITIISKTSLEKPHESELSNYVLNQSFNNTSGVMYTINGTIFQTGDEDEVLQPSIPNYRPTRRFPNKQFFNKKYCTSPIGALLNSKRISIRRKQHRKSDKV